MARVKGGLANLMTVVTDSQEASQETPTPATGEGPADGRLSVVTPAPTAQPEETAPAQVSSTAKATPSTSAPSPGEPAEPTAKATSKPKKTPAKKATTTKTAPKPAEPEVEEAELPRYLQLERKDVRMRSDQLDSLTNLSRRLNKQRRSRGERITENTLVRVAIDLLLERAEELGGLTEDDLRSSVGL